SVKMDIRGAVDAAVPTNIIAAKAAEVRANKVNWQSYLQGQMISGEDCEFIQRFEQKRNPEEKQELLQTEGNQCAKTFINLMTHISKEQTVQYILTMVDDMLQENHQRVCIFFDYAKRGKNTAWSYFLPMLNRQDLFTVHMAARIIAKLAAWGRELMEGSDLNYYFNWIKTQLSSQKLRGTGGSVEAGAVSTSDSSQYVQCVAGCLQLMLRVNEYRFAWVEADGVNCIMGVLSNKCGFQLQYQMIFCVWLLAFSPQMCEYLRRYNIVPVLSDILQESVKEKVTRIILAAFR
ncbi:VATH ATPase, partial [Ciccaba nigrolineata]|nr:VATH ATPase [Ciccaba nigrolineata]NXG78947.1 VATH ATPase [Baryphthengus martii]